MSSRCIYRSAVVLQLANHEVGTMSEEAISLSIEFQIPE